ncbi:hypothetical protein T484DRAFT_1988453 [Baffinella frigidus]|nr:hypothetical protein T484DRAFT_1988453 [Cryptophyta sp. CCMP2293]
MQSQPPSTRRSRGDANRHSSDKRAQIPRRSLPPPDASPSICTRRTGRSPPNPNSRRV